VRVLGPSICIFLQPYDGCAIAWWCNVSGRRDSPASRICICSSPFYPSWFSQNMHMSLAPPNQFTTPGMEKQSSTITISMNTSTHQYEYTKQCMTTRLIAYMMTLPRHDAAAMLQAVTKSHDAQRFAHGLQEINCASCQHREGSSRCV